MKKISSQYNEESQKLDLMMKVQQARQRQTLQRKLLERKNASNASQGRQTLPPLSLPQGVKRAGLHAEPVRGIQSDWKPGD